MVSVLWFDKYKNKKEEIIAAIIIHTVNQGNWKKVQFYGQKLLLVLEYSKRGGNDMVNESETLFDTYKDFKRKVW